MEVQQEYARIKALFANIDEKQLELVDGAIWEAARLKNELDELHEAVKKSGLLKLHPSDPSRQKELPVSRLIVRVRANYLNYLAKLSNVLGRDISDDDNDLDEYE